MRVINRKEKGITLVALVITIIILLILAAVTINMLLGDNGLISKTKESVAKYKNAQELENSMLSQFETEMDNYLNGGNEKSITRKITTENVASHIGEYIDLGTNLIDKNRNKLNIMNNDEPLFKYSNFNNYQNIKVNINNKTTNESEKISEKSFYKNG